MRQLTKSDSIESLGNTPLGDDFPEGAEAEVTEVKTVPSASGEDKYVYSFETDTGLEFQLDHSDLEEAVARQVVETVN